MAEQDPNAPGLEANIVPGPAALPTSAAAPSANPLAPAVPSTSPDSPEIVPAPPSDTPTEEPAPMIDIREHTASATENQWGDSV
ncbi:MAG TPA: hypothetical protein VN612_17745 [Acidobacteriaceae bacterium]|nr:hypothetical protein [Acidobacteriaceae bacterium]